MKRSTAWFSLLAGSSALAVSAIKRRMAKRRGAQLMPAAASPTGQREIESLAAAEAMPEHDAGEQESPSPKVRQRRKRLQPNQTLNPKRHTEPKPD